jgi:hypothetical protein
VKTKKCKSELMPGAVLLGQDGAIREQESAEDLPPGARIVVTRYVIGANVILEDGEHAGEHALVALTPYYYTFAGAIQAWEEHRKDYPQCAILWSNTAVDPTDADQLAELDHMRLKWSEETAKAGIQ